MLGPGRYAQWRSRFLCLFQDGESMVSFYYTDFKSIDGYELTRCLLQTPRTRLKLPHQGYNNDNSVKQFGNHHRDNDSGVGSRETVAAAKGVLKDYALSQGKMMTVQTCEHRCSSGNGEGLEQDDWLEDTDEEIDEQELEAHYSYMAKIQDVSPEGTSSTGQPLEQIPYDTSDPANRFAPDREETMTLDNESRSKLDKDTVKPYDYTRQNSLYEIFKGPSLEYLYQLERAKEVRKTIYVKSLEKEIDELESEKADFSNMYDLLLEECVSKDVICSYLHSLSELNAHTELQCMYLHKVKECECLAQKLSKQTESVNNEVH
ncbi:hypothetical protein Tco_0885822 [Tanacetum coccineum]